MQQVEKRLNDSSDELFERKAVGELDERVLEQGSDARTCRCLLLKTLLQKVFEFG